MFFDINLTDIVDKMRNFLGKKLFSIFCWMERLVDLGNLKKKRFWLDFEFLWTDFRGFEVILVSKKLKKSSILDFQELSEEFPRVFP